jgi:cell division protein FtsZ
VLFSYGSRSKINSSKLPALTGPEEIKALVPQRRLALPERRSDEYFEKYSIIPQVTILGLGGAGCNIVSYIKEHSGGVFGARLIACNTDRLHLESTKADKKVLMGRVLCGGNGCGGDPEVGKAAARESLTEIRIRALNSEVVYLIAGLGGGTGTGAIQVLSEYFQNKGPLVIGVVTLPLIMEKRSTKAKKTLPILLQYCDSVLVIDNNELSKFAGKLPFREALNVVNRYVGRLIKDLTETVTVPSLINMDFADIRSAMAKKGLALVGFGKGSGKDRTEKCVNSALEGHLLSLNDISSAQAVLIHVTAKPPTTLRDVEMAAWGILDRLKTSPNIKIGAKVVEELEEEMLLTVVLAGIKKKSMSRQYLAKTAPSVLSNMGNQKKDFAAVKSFTAEDKKENVPRNQCSKF